MSDNLAERRCKPCEGGVAALTAEAIAELLQALHDDWQLSADGLEIARTFEFPLYSRTLGFANAVAWIATVEGHHPVLTVSYGCCRVQYSTHAVNALTENDFICAAKIDGIPLDTIA